MKDTSDPIVNGNCILLVCTAVISNIKKLNLLTGSFLGCWCNLPWVFKINFPLFLISIKQEEQCNHNGVFFQYVMKT